MITKAPSSVLTVAAALLSAAVLLAGSAAAWAAPADPDPTFGPVTNEPGQWRDSFPTDKCPGLDHAQGIAVQSSDGKIVVVGYGARDLTSPCDDPPVNEFIVTRLNTNGTLDDTFGDLATVGQSGWTTTRVTGAGSERANAVAIQSDGKIVVAGQAGAGPADSYFGLARYNTDGTLDTTFGATCSGGETPGTTSTNFAGTLNQATAVAVQPDGKIVAAGYTLTSTSNFDFALARYDTNGCPDSTFGPGHDGKAIYGFPAAGNDKAHALVIQPSGKIVVAGAAYGGSIEEFGLARFNSDGSPDGTFGTNGETLTDFGAGGQSTSANALVAQADGRLIAAGSTFTGATTWIDFALARFSADGAPDTSFGTGGQVTTNFSPRTGFAGQSTDAAQSLAITASGGIVAAGSACCDSGGNNDFAVAAYNGDGSLDPSFGAGGELVKDIGGGHDELSAVATDAGGKILTAGWDTILSGTEDEFVVNRYLGSGVPDSTLPVAQIPGGGTPGGGLPGGSPTDTVAPVFLAAKLTNKTFVVDPRGRVEKAITAIAKKGTTFVYSLSEASRVLVTIDQSQKGRKVGKQCRKPSAKNKRGKSCTRYVKIATFAQSGSAGANSKKFSGRIGKHSLKPGSYRATLVARDAAGNASQRKQLTFNVVKK